MSQNDFASLVYGSGSHWELNLVSDDLSSIEVNRKKKRKKDNNNTFTEKSTIDEQFNSSSSPINVAMPEKKAVLCFNIYMMGSMNVSKYICKVERL